MRTDCLVELLTECQLYIALSQVHAWLYIWIYLIAGGISKFEVANYQIIKVFVSQKRNKRLVISSNTNMIPKDEVSKFSRAQFHISMLRLWHGLCCKCYCFPCWALSLLFETRLLLDHRLAHLQRSPLVLMDPSDNQFSSEPLTLKIKLNSVYWEQSLIRGQETDFWKLFHGEVMCWLHQQSLLYT